MTSPLPSEHTPDRRETAEGCRDRAEADLLESVTMSTANGRRVLESSAASWTARAEMLQRIETGIEKRRNAPVLTEEEIAEDAAELRL
jgi:hypothetical protein